MYLSMNYFKEKLHEILIEIPKIIEHEWIFNTKYRARILKRASQYLIILSLIFITGVFINNNVISPLNGGTYVEGVTEQMHFLNPIYTQNETELAISKLIYAPLLQFDSHGNTLPILAKSFTTPDAETKEYLFTLRDNIYFHDGIPITSDDVIFTFNSLKNQKNPNTPNSFLSNIDITPVDLKTIKFTLKEPYAGMRKRLSEIGIIPKHVWDIPYEEALISQNQTKSAGSGPYQFYNSDNNTVTLKKYHNYKPNKGFLSYITFRKYESEDEMASLLEKGTINGYFLRNISGDIKIPPNANKYSMILPRQFILFLNPKSAYFNEQKRREVFLDHINSKTIPLPNHTFKKQSFSILESLNEKKVKRTIPAILPTLLKPNKPLSLYYLNTPILKKISEQMVTYFLTQNVPANAIPVDESTYADLIVKQKSFDIFLGGQEFLYDSDLYAYWHSTEREFPGLNISGFGKKDSDLLLEQIKKEPSITKKLDLFARYDTILGEDAVALPLFSPIALYIIDKKFSPFIDTHTLLWNKRTSWLFLWYTKSLSLYTE